MTLKEHAYKMSHNARYKHKINWYLLGQRRCHCCGVQLNWADGHKNSASVEHLIPKSKAVPSKILIVLLFVAHATIKEKINIGFLGLFIIIFLKKNG